MIEDKKELKDSKIHKNIKNKRWLKKNPFHNNDKNNFILSTYLESQRELEVDPGS